ncbi:MAG: hypothetical protein ABUT20_40355 [Bacteroidota bacterium]
MKKLLLLLCLFAAGASRAQNTPVSNEDFINEVSKLIVDRSFPHYYLSVNSVHCSFKKFDYDEWYKYALNEDVPIYILNELAKKSYGDAAPRNWQQQKLLNAICIDEEKSNSILSQSIKKHVKSGNKVVNKDNVVFYFSRPEFTGDYQYGIIDMGFRCDDQQCGMGATFLFKYVNGKWKMVGRKLIWGN